MSDDILKGIKEIAEYIGETQDTAGDLCRAGKIPAFKWAGRWRMRKSAFEEKIAEVESARAA